MFCKTYTQIHHIDSLQTALFSLQFSLGLIILHPGAFSIHLFVLPETHMAHFDSLCSTSEQWNYLAKILQLPEIHMRF